MENASQKFTLQAHTAYLRQFLQLAIQEDIGEGDHTSLATVDPDSQSSAFLLSKDEGIWVGNELLSLVFESFFEKVKFTPLKKDGDILRKGEKIYTLSGDTKDILTSERLSLNLVQHLCGVATQAKSMAALIDDLPTQLLDTRKTTPGMRVLEKWAVSQAGVRNHRMGLHDMVMIKDNHIDQCGSIEKAIERTISYLREKGKQLRIEVETRSLDDVRQVLAYKEVDWIMLDNFSPSLIKDALQLIQSQKTTEASGGINKNNIRNYAETGVNFISSGAITQRAKALDLSLRIDS